MNAARRRSSKSSKPSKSRDDFDDFDDFDVSDDFADCKFSLDWLPKKWYITRRAEDILKETSDRFQ